MYQHVLRPLNWNFCNCGSGKLFQIRSRGWLIIIWKAIFKISVMFIKLKNLLYKIINKISEILGASSEDFNYKNHKRSYYVCPPDFMRLGNKCYFFSNNTATWQEAYFHCKDFHSNLAIIKSAHQNKILRMALSKDSIGKLIFHSYMSSMSSFAIF